MLLPSEPKLLLVETSGAIGRVGLGAGSTLVSEAVLDQERRHTRDLVPQCQALLQQQSWSIRDIDGIVVSWGPGSYTGLRVGLMTGKTLAYALHKPLVTVPTFEVIARQAVAYVPEKQTLAVIADAQQDRLYVQSWVVQPFKADRQAKKPDLQIVEREPLSLVEGSAWRAELGEVWVTGPGLRQQLQKLADSKHCLPEAVWDQQLKELLQLGFNRFEKQTFADHFTVEPLYLRPSAAEIKWAEMGR